MGISIGNVLSGAASGFASSGGSPWGALAGGVAGLFGGSGKKKGPTMQDLRIEQDLANRNFWDTTMEKAKQYGINKMAALGQGASFSPSVSVGGGSSGFDAGALGQDVGRAIGALQSREERALAAVTAKQQVENNELQNQLLKSKIAQMQAGHPPAFATGPSVIDGQGNGSSVLIPTEHHGKVGYNQVGSQKKPFYQVWDSPVGPVTTFSDDVGQYMENDPLSMFQFYGTRALSDIKYLAVDYPRSLGRKLVSPDWYSKDYYSK